MKQKWTIPIYEYYLNNVYICQLRMLPTMRKKKIWTSIRAEASFSWKITSSELTVLTWNAFATHIEHFEPFYVQISFSMLITFFVFIAIGWHKACVKCRSFASLFHLHFKFNPLKFSYNNSVDTSIVWRKKKWIFVALFLPLTHSFYDALDEFTLKKKKKNY